VNWYGVTDPTVALAMKLSLNSVDGIRDVKEHQVLHVNPRAPGHDVTFGV
jgi:hypothetical protein